VKDNEIKLLEIIQENSQITQREIARKTGLSLGLVNLLLKKFVQKGFVKLEKLNKRTFRYILTPKGFKEKARKTIQYMKIYYERVKQIKANVEKIVEESGKDKIYVIFGEDEFMISVVEEILKELKVDYVVFEKLEKIDPNAVILYWDLERKEEVGKMKNFLIV